MAPADDHLVAAWSRGGGPWEAATRPPGHAFVLCVCLFSIGEGSIACDDDGFSK